MSSESISISESEGIVSLAITMHVDTLVVANEALADAMISVTNKLRGDASLSGALIELRHSTTVSAAGHADLLRELSTAGSDAEVLSQNLGRLSVALRRLERCGKPVVALIPDGAHGVALEIALACHYRIAADTSTARFSHPCLDVGLTPGAGGSQRLLRSVGLHKAVDLLLKKKVIDVATAFEFGLVEELVKTDALAIFDTKWLQSHPDATQPWDTKGFRVPGGAGQETPALMQLFSALHGLLLGRTQDNYPAARALVSTLYEGSTVPMDAALRIETRYLTQLILNPVAKNLVQTLKVSKSAADNLLNRPPGLETQAFRKVAVLGAGMMGAGIAYSIAAAGIEVVLLDRSTDLAKKGKSHSKAIVAKAVRRGRMSDSEADSLLNKITPTSDYADLKNCDLVIEAVFEDLDIKADVTRKAEAVIPATALYASNTSTIKISLLAKAAVRPDQFIGLHFSSPVDRMPIVEVIVGNETSQETLARSLDFAAAISKTPIVVNDQWGFYLSRVFGVFPDQGMLLLQQGVAPALIENAAKQAGMPVGPLAVIDEVSLELSKSIHDSLAVIAGDDYVTPRSRPVVELMVDKLGRLGRKSGHGFYEYPEEGKKFLWPELQEHFPLLDKQPPVAEVKNCLLYRQALEAVRCLEESVVTTAADADVCAVVGWNFPAYTGGPLSLIDTVGVNAFVTECERLAEIYGDQFLPPQRLLDMRKDSKSFY